MVGERKAHDLLLREPVKHGDLDFPFQVYHAVGLYASYHWHEECEFMYIKKGVATIRIGLENWDVREGQSIYIQPNTLHAVSSVDIQNLEFYAIVFHPQFLHGDFGSIKKYISKRYVIQKIFDSDQIHEKEIIDLLLKICLVYEQKPFAHELFIKDYLVQIFRNIFVNQQYIVSEVAVCDVKHKKLESVIQYIQEHFQGPIQPVQLAQIAGYSLSYFNRFFKEISGQTPIEYIIGVRIEHAIELLKNTNLSVTEIALDSGFDNIGYFIRTFKKYTKFTPGAYHKQFNKSST